VTTINAPTDIIVIPPPPLPDALTNLTATTLDSTRIEITWDVPELITGNTVELWRSLDNVTFTVLIAGLDIDDALYINTGLTPATQYWYKARAINETGPSAYSNTDSDTTDVAPVAVPTAPSLLSAVTRSSSAVDVAWTDNSNNESGFKLHRSVNGGGFTLRATILPNVTFYEDRGLTASTLYAYKVLAYNVAGDSAFSNTDSDTTDAPTIPPPVTQNVFFVSTTGNNTTGTGAISAPWRTLAKALSIAKAGATIYLRGGTYAEAIKSSTQTLWTGTSWAAPITVSAYLAEVVTLEPTAYAVIQIFGAAHRYYHFKNLILSGANVSDFVIALDGSFAAGAGYFRFTNCEILNAPRSGVLLGGASNFNEFISCEVHGNGHTPTGGSTRSYGFYIQSSSNLLQGCNIYNHTGYGVHIYNGYTGQRASNNIIRRCVAHGNSTAVTNHAGFLVGSGDNNLIENCIAYDQPVGIRVGYKNSLGTKVYHCTCTDNSLDGLHITSSSATVSVTNNIFYNNGTNINNDSTGATFSANLQTDPDFVNAGINDYHLQSTSDAIAYGTSLPVVTTDYDSNVRPTNGTWDAGAYQKV
jgi:hypothetical protein